MTIVLETLTTLIIVCLTFRGEEGSDLEVVASAKHLSDPRYVVHKQTSEALVKLSLQVYWFVVIVRVKLVFRKTIVGD